MKSTKTITIVLFAILYSVFPVYAQTIFSEDFEGLTPPALPDNWLTTSQGTDDGFYTGTADDAILGGFWIIKDHTTFAMTNDDVCVCDKSNDFLILPMQDFSAYSGQTIFLQFDTWMEDLWGGESKVKVDTGTGWIDIYAMVAKAEWQTRVVNLSAFSSCTSVSVAFHYNDLSQSGLGLAVDNISIFIPEYQFDAAIYTVENTYSDYPEIPFSQLIPITHSSTVYNNGKDTLRNLQIIAQSAQTTYKDTVFLSSLAPAEYLKTDFTDPFIIPETGLTSLNYSILHDNTDEDIANHLQTYNFAVDDSTLAKEDGTFDEAILLYDGETTAQAFTVFTDDTLTSVTVKLMFASVTDIIKFYIYEYDDYYGPTVIIDSTQAAYTPATGWTTYSFATDTSSGVGLAAGEYCIAMKKIGSGMTGLSATTDYYMPDATFTSHLNGPMFVFYMDEQWYGGVAGKHHTYLMRPNFGEDQSSSVGFKEVGRNQNIDVNIYPNPASDFVRIVSETKINQISIYSINGAELLSKSLDNFNTRLNTSFLNKGVYLLKIGTEGQLINRKLLITE